jgi:LysM repeat protein
VQLGETLFEIANRFDVTAQQIFAANPQIIDVNKIFTGQQICIPAAQ